MQSAYRPISYIQPCPSDKPHHHNHKVILKISDFFLTPVGGGGGICLGTDNFASISYGIFGKGN